MTRVKRVRCNPCGRETRQFLVLLTDRRENGMSNWRCGTCGRVRIQLGNLEDLETVCRSVLDDHLRKTGAKIDYQDGLQSMIEEAWDLWGRFDPSKGVPFLAYCVGLLRLRAANFYRHDMGRAGQKAHANALSLDATLRDDDGGELTWQALLEGAGDPSEERSTDLTRILAG